jgi:hypothetical protein
MTDVLEKADRLLIARVQTWLGHAAPFSADECAKITGPLEVYGTETLEGIQALTGLEQLGLIGCDAIEDLQPLAALTKLRELKIAGCPLKSTRGLAKLRSLSSLDLHFTLVTDASEILSHASLRKANLYANPWTEGSYRKLSADKRFSVSPEADWRLGVSLAKHGLPLAYGAVPGRARTLVMPGKGTGRVLFFDEVAADALQAALAGAASDVDPYEFFEAFPENPDRDGSPERFWTPFSS